MGLYSLVAIATFAPLVSHYLEHRHMGPLLWLSPAAEWMHGIAMVLMAIAFVLIAASLIIPAPTLASGQQSANSQTSAVGIHLLTRHPLFMELAVWAAVHLIYNGFDNDVACFGGFIGFAFLGGRHQD